MAVRATPARPPSAPAHRGSLCPAGSNRTLSAPSSAKLAAAVQRPMPPRAAPQSMGIQCTIENHTSRAMGRASSSSLSSRLFVEDLRSGTSRPVSRANLQSKTEFVVMPAERKPPKKPEGNATAFSPATVKKSGRPATSTSTPLVPALALPATNNDDFDLDLGGNAPAPAAVSAKGITPPVTASAEATPPSVVVSAAPSARLDVDEAPPATAPPSPPPVTAPTPGATPNWYYFISSHLF
jgi:hypothetical protein